MSSEHQGQHYSRDTDPWSRIYNIWRISLEKDAIATGMQSSRAELTMISTATVFSTTILQTTFVTVYITTSAATVSPSMRLTSSRTPREVSPSSTHVQFPESTITLGESLASAAPPSRTILENNTSTLTSPAAETPSIMSPDRAPLNASDSVTGSSIGAHGNEPISRRAIIGGLSGSIAGLLLVGVIIFVVMRRRRRKQESQDPRYYCEKHDFSQPAPQLPPIFPARSHSPMTIGRPSTSQPAVDEDHRIIRMSTKHWPRPYAPGGAEGHRQSRSTTKLRVMNPDASRPHTPQRRPSTETTRTYLSKKRSILTDVLHGAATRLRSSSLRTEFSSPAPPVPPLRTHNRPDRDKPLPIIRVIDPNLSRECVARNSQAAASAPSFRSYPSLSTVQPHRSPPTTAPSPSIHYVSTSSVIAEQKPRDPFKTPSFEAPKVQRPALATLQSAASSVATKMWPSSVRRVRNSTPRIETKGSPRSNRLTPSSCRSPSQRYSDWRKDASLRGQSELSISTFTSGQWSTRSDPFDLDRGSWRGGRGSLGFGAVLRTKEGVGVGGSAESETHGAARKDLLYEGT